MIKNHAGFTLMELMISIAIVSIVTALAIPAYHNYTVRARVAEGLQVVAAAKTAVSETFITTGAFPANNPAAGLPATISSQMVGSVQVGNNGVITVTFDANAIDVAANENTIIYTPTGGNSVVSWTCTGGSLLDDHRPQICR